MLRKIFKRLFHVAPAVPDWTAGWDHVRRDGAPDPVRDDRRRARPRPSVRPCRCWIRAGWDA